MDQFANPNLVPGLIMMGSLAVPLATVFLFFELNTPRNVSFHQVLMLVCFGGIVSLFVSLLGFSVSNLDWLGASSAGIVEETGKLLAVALIARKAKYKYILNGMLFGAAVGAGFAAFESAGYAFRELLNANFNLDAMSAVIHLRAFLTPFGHVAWTAIAAGALWRTKGDRNLTPSMFTDPTFLKAFSIPVVLHMIWNSPIPSPFHVLQLALGAAGWFVVFGLVQQGLYQVRHEQIRIAEAELATMETRLPN
jgi:RsiW-degrading membrane proteinase PrsW (M82 family)